MSASNSRSNAGLSQVGGYPRRRQNQQYVLSILPSNTTLKPITTSISARLGLLLSDLPR
jgi:hypothetical protein